MISSKTFIHAMGGKGIAQGNEEKVLTENGFQKCTLRKQFGRLTEIAVQ